MLNTLDPGWITYVYGVDFADFDEWQTHAEGNSVLLIPDGTPEIVYNDRLELQNKKFIVGENPADPPIVTLTWDGSLSNGGGAITSDHVSTVMDIKLNATVENCKSGGYIWSAYRIDPSEDGATSNLPPVGLIIGDVSADTTTGTVYGIANMATFYGGDMEVYQMGIDCAIGVGTWSVEDGIMCAGYIAGGWGNVSTNFLLINSVINNSALQIGVVALAFFGTYSGEVLLWNNIIQNTIGYAVCKFEGAGIATELPAENFPKSRINMAVETAADGYTVSDNDGQGYDLSLSEPAPGLVNPYPFTDDINGDLWVTWSRAANVSSGSAPLAPTTPDPADGTTVTERVAQTLVVTNADAGTVDITFYDTSSGVPVQIGQVQTDIPPGGTATVNAIVVPGETFTWQATATNDDGSASSVEWSIIVNIKSTVDTLSPASGTILPYGTPSQLLGAKYHHATGGTGSIAFYDIADPENPVLIDTAEGLSDGDTGSVTWSDLEVGTWAWKAVPNDGIEDGEESDPTYFTVEAAPAITDMVPADGAVINNPPPVSLECFASWAARSFVVYAYNADDGVEIGHSSPVTGSGVVSIPWTLTASGSHSFYFRLKSGSEWSDVSDTHTFTFNYTSYSNITPAEGSLVHDECELSVDVSWPNNSFVVVAFDASNDEEIGRSDGISGSGRADITWELERTQACSFYFRLWNNLAWSIPSETVSFVFVKRFEMDLFVSEVVDVTPHRVIVFPDAEE